MTENGEGKRKRMKKGVTDTLKGARMLPLQLIAKGLAAGVLSGFVVMMYRWVLQKADEWLKIILECTARSYAGMAGWFLILILLALIVGYLVRLEPMISGSGIPQLEGEMAGKLNQTWWKVLPAKFSGGFLCLLGGLSLGREGPSIQLGAMAGKAVSRLFSLGKSEEKYMLTCGASAGLAAAFHAPLAGVLFSLEEIHKNFSVSVLICVMTASVTADYFTSEFLGSSPIFSFKITEDLPMQYYWMVLILGLLLGAFGVFYNWFTLKVQSIYLSVPWLNPATRLVLPFLTAGILGYTVPVLLGSGGNLITMVTTEQLGLTAALFLLAGKFLFSAVCFGSGAPGGIFFPLLVLGGLTGGIFGMGCSEVFGLPPEYVNNFVLLAMAGYFTAIVRAPLTGIILIFEMTGSLSQLASLTLVSIAAFVVATLMRSEPIYESLLEGILKRQGERIPEDAGDRVLREYAVMYRSRLDGRKISEIQWPAGSLIVTVKRGGREILPVGSTRLKASDTIMVLAGESQEANVHKRIQELCMEVPGTFTEQKNKS